MLENEHLTLIQAQEGDPEAFSRLVEAYQRSVFNLCYRMSGNTEDAEDAAQETFLRAYKSIRQYDLNRPFITWILSIAAHYCIDQARRRRFPEVSLEDLPLPDLPDQSPTIEKNLAVKEDQQQIRLLLKVLEPTDRAAVVMYYWYDFSYSEISRALSLTESAIKSRLHRARRTMAEDWLRRQSPNVNVENYPMRQEVMFPERMAP